MVQRGRKDDRVLPTWVGTVGEAADTADEGNSFTHMGGDGWNPDESPTIQKPWSANSIIRQRDRERPP